ncbi:amino acid ABC transporter permease [Gallibacter intestinalis]|uniref:Amino acid ABC transporter permease n=1 Tax=Gallibacter intestinalis TaxID=2779356 RepID=A0ABR9QYC9_9FIRM|nr:amino acid ABC transporter permease [Gallibacter intestinalis]MBE5035874.1 amino acid ABC transporter permease [Gallibacter intestinalis]
MSEIIGYMPLLMDGLLITLVIFALTLIFSLPLGLPIALGEEVKFKPLAYLCRAYVWIFRGTPLMLQLFFFYFFFPIVLNIRLDALPTAILTFILNYAAYFAEIYRGGFKSIDRGQHEAAFALGLSKRQTMFGILLPQTMKAILPPVFNEVITLVKDTALVMSIGGVADIMKNANSIVNRTSSITPLVVAGAIYLILTFLLTIGANKIERYFGRYDQRGDQ